MARSPGGLRSKFRLISAPFRQDGLGLSDTSLELDVLDLLRVELDGTNRALLDHRLDLLELVHARVRDARTISRLSRADAVEKDDDAIG